MELRFSGTIWYWRGPAPWYFVTVPEEDSQELQDVSSALTYGWGVIPVQARIGRSTWDTSLFPKDGLYALPIKTAIRRAEDVDEGDLVSVVLTTGDPVLG
jgi:hypothetical protein